MAIFLPPHQARYPALRPGKHCPDPGHATYHADSPHRPKFKIGQCGCLGDIFCSANTNGSLASRIRGQVSTAGFHATFSVGWRRFLAQVSVTQFAACLAFWSFLSGFLGIEIVNKYDTKGLLLSSVNYRSLAWQFYEGRQMGPVAKTKVYAAIIRLLRRFSHRSKAK